MLMQAQVYQARLRLAQHYAKFISDNNQLYLRGGENSISALDRLDADRAQLDSWLNWLSEQANHDEQAARLFIDLLVGGDDLFSKRWSYPEQLSYHSHALQFAESLQITTAIITHLQYIGLAHLSTGDPNLAIYNLDRSRALAEAGGYKELVADIMTLQVDLYIDSSQFEEARAIVQQALLLYQQLNNAAGIGKSLLHFAWIALSTGDWQEAEHYMHEAHDPTMRTGDYGRIAFYFTVWSVLKRKMGDAEQSQYYALKAIEFNDRINNQTQAINYLMNLAVSYDMQSNFSTAQSYYLQALKTSRRVGVLRFEAIILGNLGYSYYLQGNYAEAVAYMEESLPLIRLQNFSLHTGFSLANIIPAYLPLGKYAEARNALQEGLVLAINYVGSALKLTMLVAAVQTWVASAQSQTSSDYQHALATSAALWSGLVMAHPNAEAENHDEITKRLPEIRAVLGEAHTADLMSEGAGLDLDSVLLEIQASLQTTT